MSDPMQFAPRRNGRVPGLPPALPILEDRHYPLNQRTPPNQFTSSAQHADAKTDASLYVKPKQGMKTTTILLIGAVAVAGVFLVMRR